MLWLFCLLSVFIPKTEAMGFGNSATPFLQEPLLNVPDGIDTIYVSNTENTYLLFPEEVNLVDIGRTGAFAARIEGECVFLKALTSQSVQTSFLVRYGKQYMIAKLVNSNSPKKILYDFRGNTSPPVDSGVEKKEEKVEHKAAAEGLETIKEQKGRKITPVKSQHGLKVGITHLQNDREATYLGIFLRNNSSIDYKIDFVGFALVEKRGRRFSRNNRVQKELIPFASNGPTVIQAGEEEVLFYALPLYAMSSRGKLQIQIREKRGARILRLSIPSRKINNAQILDHEQKSNS